MNDNQKHGLSAAFPPKVLLEAFRDQKDDKIRQLESDCAVMREALQKWRDYFQKDVPNDDDQKEQHGEDFTDAWFESEKALATNSGKSLLERIDQLEKERDNTFGALGSAKLQIDALEKQLADERKYSEDLAADICKMEDVLGFKNDCHDKDGAFVPTMVPWLDRIRDLLAAEGELGDMRDQLQAHKSALQSAREELELARRNYIRIHAHNIDQLKSMPSPYDDSISQINSVLGSKGDV